MLDDLRGASSSDATQNEFNFLWLVENTRMLTVFRDDEHGSGWLKSGVFGEPDVQTGF